MITGCGAPLLVAYRRGVSPATGSHLSLSPDRRANRYSSSYPRALEHPPMPRLRSLAFSLSFPARLRLPGPSRRTPPSRHSRPDRCRQHRSGGVQARSAYRNRRSGHLTSRSCCAMSMHGTEGWKPLPPGDPQAGARSIRWHAFSGLSGIGNQPANLADTVFRNRSSNPQSSAHFLWRRTPFAPGRGKASRRHGAGEQHGPGQAIADGRIQERHPDRSPPATSVPGKWETRAPAGSPEGRKRGDIIVDG